MLTILHAYTLITAYVDRLTAYVAYVYKGWAGKPLARVGRVHSSVHSFSCILLRVLLLVRGSGRRDRGEATI